jgi:carbon-monoxide dehydrogenase large subunit
VAGYVGRAIPRLEDPRLLAGRGAYLDDLRPPGTLSVAFVRSPHPHARVLAVDVAAAGATPGVVEVLTGAGLAGAVRPLRAELAVPGYTPTSWPALADRRVRFVGEAVAAVAATDRYVAEDAAGRVVVRYEPLPAVADAEAAMAPGAVAVHDDHPGNVLVHLRHEAGAVDEVFREADLRVSATLRHARCAAAPLEGRGILADVDRATGGLVVWASTQVPHLLRAGLAGVLGLAESRIRVVVPDVGGGFGPKMHVFPEDVVVSVLALRLGRPVKWVETRTENLMAGAHAREHVAAVEVAARRDGTILAVQARLLCDVGAYSLFPTSAALEPITAAGLIPGPYRIRSYRYDAYAVATNKCPTGAYRGVGQALAAYVRERMVDLVARRAELDPAEVRRRNLLRTDECPYTTASGLVLDSGSPAESFARLLDMAGYDGLRREQEARRAAGHRRYRGIGLASYTEFTGMGAATFRRRGMVHIPGHDAAMVRVEPSGEARAFVSTVTQGQGHLTALAQLLADELGWPLRDVSVVEGDTDRCPHGSGAFASRSVVAAGGALILAARAVRAKVLRIAAHRLEAAVDDLVLAEGVVAVRGVPDRRLDVREVARMAYQGASALPDGLEPGLEATRFYDPPPATFSTGAHLAVVDVDAETGRVDLVRHVVVEDCGRMINPMIVEGQIHGAVGQGVGNALHEALVYDGAGQLLTGTLMDYHLPRADELPSIEIGHVTTPPPVSLAGFKGMAEGGTIGAVAAVANAVADALGPVGGEVCELPLTPARVLGLIRGEGQTAPSSVARPPR